MSQYGEAVKLAECQLEFGGDALSTEEIETLARALLAADAVVQAARLHIDYAHDRDPYLIYKEMLPKLEAALRALDQGRQDEEVR